MRRLKLALGTVLAVICCVGFLVLAALVWKYLEVRPDNIEVARIMEGRIYGPPFGNAKIVIEKLNTYKKARGRYPESLDQLVPKFIDNIPPPGWGTNEWVYRSDGTGFGLHVLRLKDWYYGHYYSSKTGSWVYDH